ncbi:hypothetical protein [Natronospora cellulosivora (SeqCode)]
MKKSKILLLFTLFISLFLLVACNDPYEISGTITDEEGNVIDNLVLLIEGEEDSLVVSEFGPSGEWSATVYGTVELTPVQASYAFTPESKEIIVPSSDISFVGKTNWVEFSEKDIEYQGIWRDMENEGAKDGIERTANRNNATLEFTFTGSGFQWLASTGRARGKANIYLNGELIASEVDSYSSETVNQAIIYSKTGLEEDTYTVKIEPTMTHNDDSLSTLITVDYFNFIPAEGYEEVTDTADSAEEVATELKGEIAILTDVTNLNHWDYQYMHLYESPDGVPYDLSVDENGGPNKEEALIIPAYFSGEGFWNFIVNESLKISDWREYKKLEVDVLIEGDEIDEDYEPLLQIGIESLDGYKMSNNNHSISLLEPGEWKTVSLPLDDLEYWNQDFVNTDLENVAGIRVVLRSDYPLGEVVYTISNLRLVK